MQSVDNLNKSLCYNERMARPNKLQSEIIERRDQLIIQLEKEGYRKMDIAYVFNKTKSRITQIKNGDRN